MIKNMTTLALLLLFVGTLGQMLLAMAELGRNHAMDITEGMSERSQVKELPRGERRAALKQLRSDRDPKITSAVRRVQLNFTTWVVLTSGTLVALIDYVGN